MATEIGIRIGIEVPASAPRYQPSISCRPKRLSPAVDVVRRFPMPPPSASNLFREIGGSYEASTSASNTLTRTSSPGSRSRLIDSASLAVSIVDLRFEVHLYQCGRGKSELKDRPSQGRDPRCQPVEKCGSHMPNRVKVLELVGFQAVCHQRNVLTCAYACAQITEILNFVALSYGRPEPH